ncbi:MAG TPA: hypothetical protein VFC63_02145, partial [Blastocatellia bacterium]|nr:hypothetical protein [Blastocatellia bacterium]
TQGQEDQARAEYDAFMKAYNAANQDKDTQKTYTFAKEYLAKYPSGKYVDNTKPLVMWALNDFFSTAFKAGNYDKDFDYAHEMLDLDPNNFTVRYQLVYIGNLQFRQGKWGHADDVLSQADKVEQAIGGSKPSTMDDATWAQQKPIWLAIIYQTRGLNALNNKKPDEALPLLKKSAEYYPSDPMTYYYLGFIYGQTYQTAKDAYDKMTDEQKASDAGTAAFDGVSKAADTVIDNSARFLAASDGKPGFDDMRQKTQSTLVALYTFRHKDNPNGWQDLVNQYKANPGKSGM